MHDGNESETSSLRKNRQTAQLSNDNELVIEMGRTLYSDLLITWTGGRRLQMVSSVVMITILWVIQSYFPFMIWVVAGDNFMSKIAWGTTGRPAAFANSINIMKNTWGAQTFYKPPGNRLLPNNATNRWMSCTDRAWNYQQEKLSTIKQYSDHNRGRVCAIISLFLWVSLCCKEIFNILNHASLICVGVARRHHHVSTHNYTWQLQNLTKPIRVMVMVVTAVRTLLILLLLIAGCSFLAQTETVQDLLVNGLVFAFIVELDKWLFEVLVPQSRKDKLACLEPVEIHQPAIAWVFEHSDWLSVVWTFFLTFIVYLVCVRDFASKYEDTLNFFCDNLMEDALEARPLWKNLIWWWT